MQHKGRIIKLQYMTLPSGIHGAVREMEHSYVILINSDSPGIVQRFAIGHEFAHIFLDHFESSKGVLELEKEANKRAWEFYRFYRDNQKERG